MFKDNERRLVQVTTVVNTISEAENAPRWRVLKWLADQVGAGLLLPLHIPARTQSEEMHHASQDESRRVWRMLATNVNRKKLDHDPIPLAASTWFVHVDDLSALLTSAAIDEPAKRSLRDLVYRHCHPNLVECLPSQTSMGDESTTKSLQHHSAGKGRRIKRAALVQEHQQHWPTIDRDLKDASSNGLSKAAKAEGKGWWWEGLATEWAQVQGKLNSRDAAPSASVFTQSHIHRMKR